MVLSLPLPPAHPHPRPHLHPHSHRKIPSLPKNKKYSLKAVFFNNQVLKYPLLYLSASSFTHPTISKQNESTNSNTGTHLFFIHFVIFFFIVFCHSHFVHSLKHIHGRGVLCADRHWGRQSSICVNTSKLGLGCA